MNLQDKLVALLEKKQIFKLEIKRAKRKIKAQNEQIEKQKSRAENGQSNTLAFEQRQLPQLLLVLQQLERQISRIKLDIKTFTLRNEHSLPNINDVGRGTTIEPPPKLITFDSPQTATKLHNELKGYFDKDVENELLKALNGEQVDNSLVFPHNQNRLVEVFKRAKYNQLITSSSTEIKNWLCLNFIRKTKGELKKFNPNSVYDILTKDKGEPTKKERICVVDWLPYKTHSERKRK